MIRSTVPSRTRLIRRTLLALLALAALWGALVLALSSGPAEADTIFTVNRTGDAGDRRLTDSVCDVSRKRGKQCTLRAAIEEANDTLGTDTINFNIGGTNSVKSIAPASPLPQITDTVTINGYTQRGASENTNELSQGSNAVLKIVLNGTNAGTDAIPNPNGLGISASNSTIKGLVINRFGPNGIDSNAVVINSGATGNKVEGNFIGTNASGTQALGNGFAGVFILGDDNTVGGTSPAARNVISGNKFQGVLINGVLAGGTGNKVEGNYIGTTANGNGDLGNGERGVAILQGANGNTIGGTIAGASNVISGNDVSGVQIAGSAGNKVEHNYIGTTADGSGDLGNGGQGVFIAAASNNIIGDSDPSDGATNAANTIAFNDTDGIVVSSSGTGNRILSNQIFQNGQVGIDLQGTNDVTANDDDDPDFGPNNLQNFPIITSATRSGSTTTITGTLNSNPSQTYTIRCFLADGDPSDHGEGQIFLAQDTTASTNASGDGSFTCSTTLGAGVGQQVTATATNTSGTVTGTAIGDTSEFSANVTVSAGP